MSKTLLIVIMVVAGLGMVFGLSKQKAGASWGKPLATLCAIVALLCALGHIFSGTTGPSTKSIVETEMRYLQVSTQKLGEYLAQNYAGSKALVILDPATTYNESRRAALVDGLKQGFGDKITIAAEDSPTVPEDAKKMMSGGAGGGEEMMPPMEYWLTPTVFDALIAKHAANCDLVVTMVGLPNEAGKMKVWTMSNRPKLALASGSVYELKKAIASKAVVAAVAYNPKAVYDSAPPPADVNQAFDKRFLLITPENVNDIASQNEGLFQ